MGDIIKMSQVSTGYLNNSFPFISLSFYQGLIMDKKRAKIIHNTFKVDISLEGLNGFL